AWKVPVPFSNHAADFLAFQVFLRPAQVAGNNGELLDLRVGNDVFFGNIGQWADHNMLAVIGHQLGWHGFHAATVEQVQEEGAQDVVTVMAEGNLGGP